jgi:preprotein translocase subunit Sec61beta
MADNKLHMPGSFGGLTRYDEEFASRFMISPVAVIGLLIFVICFVLALKIFYPVA